MKVVVDRSKWRSGRFGPNQTGKGDLLLRNKEGFKCLTCFILESYDVKRFGNAADPADLNLKGKKWSDCLLLEWDEGREKYINSDLTYSILQITECEDTTYKEKETELKELFKEYDITLVFKGTPVK